MTSGLYIQQNLYINPLANLTKKQDELTAAKGQVKKSNVGIDKALTPSKASIPPFVLLFIKNLFTKFIKTFIK